jgi:hypothetical protein
MDEEGDDCGKRSESEPYSESPAVQEPNGKIEPQMLPNGGFDGGEHARDSTT